MMLSINVVGLRAAGTKRHCVSGPACGAPAGADRRGARRAASAPGRTPGAGFDRRLGSRAASPVRLTRAPATIAVFSRVAGCPIARAAAAADSGVTAAAPGRRVPRPRAAARPPPPASTIGSPLRRPAAPVVTTRSPSATPSRISVRVVAFDADLDRVERRHVVDARYTPRVPPASTSGVGRHDERVGVRLGDDADARVHPGLQPVLVVRNLDLDRRGARRWIEHRRHARDPAHEAFARERIDLDAGRVADADLLEVLLDDVGDEPHARDVDDVDDRRVGGDECAGIGRAPRDEAIDRRRDDRVLEGDAQLVEPRLRLGVLRARQVERRLRGLILRLGVVERLLRQQLPLEQVARALDVGLREIQVGFTLADGGLAPPRSAASACLTCSRISWSSILAIR